jgi:glycosyltransferase involved in cell wall biosynthesis
MQVIVVPCFNEQNRFNAKKWQEIVSCHTNTQWIFVDDGSFDETLSTIGKVSGTNVTIIRKNSNVGKGEAIRAGFLHALNNLNSIEVTQVGYLDADGAFDISDIKELLLFSDSVLGQEKKIRTVIASRVKLSGRNINRSNGRHFIGRIIVSFVCRGWDLAPYDTQSGFKIFRFDSIFRKTIDRKFQCRWFFDIELMTRLEGLGSKETVEVPLMNWSEIGKGAIKKTIYLSVLKEIFLIRRIIKRNLNTSEL